MEYGGSHVVDWSVKALSSFNTVLLYDHFDNLFSRMFQKITYTCVKMAEYLDRKNYLTEMKEEIDLLLFIFDFLVEKGDLDQCFVH